MKNYKSKSLIFLLIIFFSLEVYSQNDSLTFRNYINNLVLKQKKYKSKNAKEMFDIYENDIYIYKHEIDSLYLTNNISFYDPHFVDLIAINAYFDIDTNGYAQKVKFDRLYTFSGKFAQNDRFSFTWDFLEMKIKQEMKNWKFKVEAYNAKRIRFILDLDKLSNKQNLDYDEPITCQRNMIMFVYDRRDNKNLLYLQNENHFLNIRFSNVNTK